jgi:hypothetical protein
MDRRDPVTGRYVPTGAPAIDRFHASYERRGPDECWIWLAGATGANYGAFYPGDGQVRAHVFAYELHNGPVPFEAGVKGRNRYHVHHECGNRRCVNPAHLRVLRDDEHTLIDGPGGVNARKTHCIRGHPLSGENLIVSKNGRRKNGPTWRACRTCANDRKRAKRARENT